MGRNDARAQVYRIKEGKEEIVSTAPDKAAHDARGGGMTGHAALVASGIFLSRIAGLVRERVFAHYFGSSDAADVLRAAFRIPNLLQNLFGEGALSASFIPVYVKLLSKEAGEEADKLASAIFCLLALATSCLVLIGVFATPLLIDVIAPGFTGAKLDIGMYYHRQNSIANNSDFRMKYQ